MCMSTRETHIASTTTAQRSLMTSKMSQAFMSRSSTNRDRYVSKIKDLQAKVVKQELVSAFLNSDNVAPNKEALLHVELNRKEKILQKLLDDLNAKMGNIKPANGLSDLEFFGGYLKEFYKHLKAHQDTAGEILER